MEAVIFLSIIIALFSILVSCFAIRRVKKQIAEITDALIDVKNGNGNRRILSATNELVAPLAYEINEIVVSYESRLSTVRQTEETNRQLMTSLSHDVRTPLTTLIGYLDAAHKGIVTGKDRDDYIETARRKAHDLKEYIDVLFDWFKLNSNEFAMDINIVEAAELTRNILIDWIPIFEDKQIDYNIDIPEQPFRVKLDTDGYMRILNNLIQNVISHSHADKIEIILSKQEKNMQIRLADNGIGIEKEDLKHIFERLYKCDKGRSEKGSGLGLSIAHQLVEKMNGTITANSIQGKGTEFIVNLQFRLNSNPIVYDKIDELQNIRVLVADDDVNTYYSVSQMLQEIRTQFAIQSGDEYGAFTIDWMMPDMNGIEVVRRIRKVIGNAKPIIILTAYDWSDIEEEAREAGVTAFCAKPIFMSELREVLTKPFRLPVLNKKQEKH